MRGADLLNDADVREVCLQAARRVGRRAHQIELEDITQTAYLLLAEKPDLQECAEDPEQYGLLQYRLERRLVKRFVPSAARMRQTLSYDELVGGEEEGEFMLPYVSIATASNDYTRESVESLLPSVWDEGYCYGLPRKDTAPDPDMPKGSTNKSHGNDLSAYLADINVGWHRTPLTRKERVALFLAFGMGWTQDQIAYNQGVAQQTISNRIFTAVGKIVARLNGGYWAELLDVEA